MRPGPEASSVQAGAEVRRVGEVSPTLRNRLLNVWVEATAAGGAVGFLPGATAEDHAPTLDDHLGNVGDGGWTLGVLEVDGEVAGFGFLVRHTAAVMVGRATLIRLMVAPRWAGRGLGSVLLAGLEELARQDGLHLLDATYRDGTGLGHFYARNGWSEVGRLPDGLTVAPDDLRDDVWVAKRL